MQLYRILSVFIIIFCLILPFVGAVPDTNFSVLISQENGTHMEVDHVVVRGGTAEEIGYAIGTIGIEEFDSILIPFDDPIYGKAKESYIDRIDTVLSERVMGIKKAYGLDPDDYSLDPSFPVYILRFPHCSAIYFPPALTENGHAIIGRNMEWTYNPDEDEFAALEEGDLEKFITDEMGSWNHVLEIYPDDGYDTLAIGSSDLLCGVSDGLNEHGLAVTVLQDGDSYNDPLSSLAGGRTTGLNFLQVLRSVIENCATIEEAKEQILINKISMPFIGDHFLIADPYGAVTIVEFDKDSREVIFTDFQDKAVPLTNYAIHLSPDVSELTPESDDPHDDYHRSIELHEFIDTHEGTFNVSDAWEAMALVQADADGSSEGRLTGETVRLLWTVVTDLTDRTMTVKFFLKDGPIIDEQFGIHELILSEPFTFRLEE